MLLIVKLWNYENSKLHWNGSRNNCNGIRLDLVRLGIIVSYISCTCWKQYGKERAKVIFINWTCPKCSTELDRDENASINILKEGLKIHRQELSITKVEEKLDISNSAYPVKPEAHHIGSAVCG